MAPLAGICPSDALDRQVVLSSTGGGPGAGWWFVACWIPVEARGYELRLQTDQDSERVVRTSREPLTWRRVVRDIQSDPRLQVADTEYNFDAACTERLPSFAADLAKMACVLNEDYEPMQELSFLLEQSDEFLKKLRKSVGRLYGQRSQKSVARLRHLLGLLGEDQDTLGVGTRHGWSLDQSLTKLACILTRTAEETGHDRAWSNIPPDRTKIFWWLDDPIRRPRTPEEFELMLDVWLASDPKPEFEPHLSESEIIAKLAGALVSNEMTFSKIKNRRPDLLIAFRDEAKGRISNRYRPEERPPVGPAGLLGYRWQQWGRAYDVMCSRLWSTIETGQPVRS